MTDEVRLDWRDRDSTLRFLERVLETSQAAQSEVTLEGSESSLTRFANSRIHQNVSESDCRLSIRSIDDGCIGNAGTNRFDEESIRHALEWARDVARLGRIPAEPANFPGPETYASITNHFRTTAHLSPRGRAEMAGRLIEECASRGAEGAGAVSNSENVLAIANSEGLRAYHVLTDANFTATVSVDSSTGWCDCHSADASTLDAEEMGRRALERALGGRNPREIKPGRYAVILEEAAVNDLLEFLAWLGFGAQAFEEGRSFMCGRLGKKITGENVTIADNPLDPLARGTPFDYEGVPKKRVVLVENGVARTVVYDRAHAVRAGTLSTGHAMPAGFTYGPLPLNLTIDSGESTSAEMLKSVKRGLLITRFWYVRVVDPAKTLITGQTRDGTFLIEDGEVVCGVRDMRFNENILEVFSRAEMISQEVRYMRSTTVPAMKIADFRFTEPVGA
jgi:predicted Zn-dependent protease